MSDDESRAIFREEALDLLAELESTLLELEANPLNMDLVNQVFRALHTIKGSGAMFGFDEIADFTHAIEGVFDKVRNEELHISRELVSTAFAARDHILGLLNGVDELGNGSPERGQAIHVELQGLLDPLSQQPASATDSTGTVDTAVPPSMIADPDLSTSGQDSGCCGQPDDVPVTYRIRIRPRDPKVGKELNLQPIFDDLHGLGECRLRMDDSALPDLSQLDPQNLYLSWEALLTTTAAQSQILDLFFFADIDLDVDLQPVTDSAAAEAFDSGPGMQTGSADAGESVQPQHPLLTAPSEGSGTGDSTATELGPSSPQAQPAPKPQTCAAPASTQAAFPPREAAPKSMPRDGVNSLRVAADKLDTLVDLVGELVIVQAQITQIVSERGDSQLTALAEQLERLSADLRDSTLGIRMLPIGSAFSKFRRLVRDLSAELGKEIELVTRGEETELDKTVLERLGDPLVHLLRNSIDHGIDMPEERKTAGKRPQGLILLEAEHSGSEVLIRITDDGKGMDPDAIRRKAVEKGLIGPDAELPDKEALKLIFLPGFSTAAKVTSISGRGVGMDVVHKAIDSLRGAIEIASEPGRGTTITIRLPLTLAIIEGLQVQVGDGFYVIPLSLVEECVELHQKDVDPSGRKRIINLRGELVPYISLRRWFEIEGQPPDIEQIVITGVEGRRVGIVVDHVIGEHQTVIKSLGRVYRDVEGISGATIKGDGSLALILDVPRLVRSVAAEAAD
ncbi:CheA signal transduction histidine kinase [Humidesulfovibrio mexicanus]|uniref:Chemotaxis protein CheA n=1 Tax=Humidesulfovibrio mexicanus TaxID=147047 RepID=A0A238XQK4_9BACT|nr:chemotaxis protein CheA [Humidesulfovibrio mexicanus]SNR60821.1 CheA signal transduction histidine kinase [Humidesulfovibrio mexicanus]